MRTIVSMPSSQGRQGGGEGGGPASAARPSDLEARIARLEQLITPITPVYSMQQACILLPATEHALRQLLSRHRGSLDAPMYRHGPRHRRYRMLSHHDLLTLRAHLVRPARPSRAAMLKQQQQASAA